MQTQTLSGAVNGARMVMQAMAMGIALMLFVVPVHATTAVEISSIKADPELAALVPPYYRKQGTLTAAVNPDVVPIKFVGDDGKIIGFTPDILAAAARVLDIKLEFSQASFDSLIPGLSANRFDVLLSLADYESRQKNVTFVDYLNMGETVVARPEFVKTISANDDLCGLRLAVVRGTGSVQEVANVSDRCVGSGRKAIDVATYADANTALLSISTGTSQAAWVDSPIGYYNVNKFPGKFKVVFFDPLATYGIGFGVDEKGKQLAFAVQQALRKLHGDGVYDRVVEKWDLDPKDTKQGFPINGTH